MQLSTRTIAGCFAVALAAGSAHGQETQEFLPPEPRPSESDWIRLNSGEWLRGELRVLRDGDLEFESDELDTLKLDWDDVAEVRSPRLQTIRLESGAIHTGTLLIKSGTVRVGGGDAPISIDRARLLSITPGDPSEGAYWTGKGRVGLTGRRGNSDQTDYSASLNLRRETPIARGELQYDGSFSRVRGVETANSHRLFGASGWYLTRELFVTPIGFELFTDPFQNIALRVTPYAALGYEFFDTGKVKWSVLGGPAYRYTKFESTSAGQDREDVTWATQFGTRFEWDITPDVEYTLEYTLTTPLPDAEKYTHHFVTGFSIDFFNDLDFDIQLVWDRVNDPAPDETGAIPDQDDLRLTVGIAYEF